MVNPHPVLDLSLPIVMGFHLVLSQTTGHGLEGKFSGPLKPMTFSIFEGQEPSQIIFQFKASPPAVTFKLSGETDGIFEIQPDGLLYHNKALDRETRAVHKLQVSALDAHGNTVEGPVPITVEVKDINDNRPTFIQSKYEGSVRQNSRPGKPFMYVNATDLDDPDTPNGQLFYQIVMQLPKINNVMYFQINNKTGEISLTFAGSKELDPSKNPFYNLVVSVKDMGGQTENSFSDSTSVDITVKENIWKAPQPVEIVENSTDPHPMKITQRLSPLFIHMLPLPTSVTEADWSGIGTLVAHDMDEENTVNSVLHYKIVDQFPKFPKDGLFLIQSFTGLFQLAEQSLKKQDAAQYLLTVEVSDKDFHTLCQVKINVIDINDQIPIFEKSDYGNLTLAEDTAVGSTILTIQATDADEPFTGSSKILYRITQGDDEGRLGIDTDPQNNTGYVIIKKYGNLTLAEDTAVGSTILTIQATDADEPFTGSSKILYRITQGDDEGRLGVDTDPQKNTGYVIIKKPLDFETTAIHNIVFQAENPEPLVSGVQYNASSFATFTLFVTNVNEAPQFPQHIFQAKVSEDVAIGTKVGNMTAKDPEGLDISYSLRGDTRGWLRIDPATGEIFSAAPLDREAESLYRVQVVATEVGGSSLSTAAGFNLALTDVNDNPPRLAKEYTGLFFCHPLSAPGSHIIQATDDDLQSFRGPQFTFALGSESLQNDWEISKINGTHARLSTKHTRFEERVYNVPIRINDGGRPPLEGTVSLPVTFCSCVEGRCFRPVGHMPGIPTVGSTVGILLTTFLVIGVILTVVFIRMKKNKGKDNVESAQGSEATPLRN
ncbi:Cadherin-17 [Myotis davidii]|uniref:Cadherin-17 n=1 Tax=Myotis davidii TaxID=225400 RepID=L5M3B8_MYODS|nr:Cadherin-17 [Myotis davidii]